MIKVHLLFLEDDACVIQMAGSDWAIYHLMLYLKQFDEPGSRPPSISELENWLIQHGIYAGMVFDGKVSWHRRIQRILMRFLFNRAFRQRGMYLDEEGFFEAAFLEKPDLFCKVYGGDEQQLMNNLKNKKLLWL